MGAAMGTAMEGAVMAAAMAKAMEEAVMAAAMAAAMETPKTIPSPLPQIEYQATCRYPAHSVDGQPGWHCTQAGACEGELRQAEHELRGRQCRAPTPPSRPTRPTRPGCWRRRRRRRRQLWDRPRPSWPGSLWNPWAGCPIWPAGDADYLSLPASGTSATLSSPSWSSRDPQLQA